jgi:hypothetical protein
MHCCTSDLLRCLQMAVKADYWDCAATLCACCEELRVALARPTITAADLTQLFTLLPEQVCILACALLLALTQRPCMHVCS